LTADQVGARRPKEHRLVSDDKEFLRAIIADPDDAALRLVYADWLEERGDPRSDFLRVQSALATLPPGDRRRAGLQAWLGELRQDIDPKWRAVIELRLPEDLVEFLAAGKQLEYDPALCEAGVVTLMPLPDLKLERFPMGTSRFWDRDPHFPEDHSYLVLGVDLVASCTDFPDPDGVLLWLPVERRYGNWDWDRGAVLLFGPKVTWEQIAASPVAYIDAAWTGSGPDGAPMEFLVPWPAHPYGDKQVYDPQPAE
jgi:uncharacterized protein (TIGR02996 family)